METQPTAPGGDTPAPVAQPPASTTGETAAPAGESQPGDGTAPPVAPPETPKAPSPLQARIDQLTRQRHEAERQAQAERAQREQLELQQRVARSVQEVDAQEPQPEQFQTLLDYQRAVANWSTQRALAIFEAKSAIQQHESQRSAAQEQERQQEAAARLHGEQQRIVEKLKDAPKKYPDFVQTVNNPDLPSSRGTPLFEAVMSADNAADISYSLAKNPAEYLRLLHASIQNPVQAFKEIAALDAKFSAASKSTGAPPPPPDLGGSSTVSGQPDPKDTEAWMKWRDADIKAKRKRRA